MQQLCTCGQQTLLSSLNQKLRDANTIITPVSYSEQFLRTLTAC